MRKVRGTCLWGLAPEMAETGKAMENRPVGRNNWVRARQVTPPRKSAIFRGKRFRSPFRPTSFVDHNRQLGYRDHKERPWPRLNPIQNPPKHSFHTPGT